MTENDSLSVPHEPILADAARIVGDAAAVRLLAELVALAPTNVEDPVHARWEKPNYVATAERIVRAAREFGLATRVYDPLADPAVTDQYHGIPRPNVVVDLDHGRARRLLLLAHYDVVPVPEEQLSRWRTPPHVLSARDDGRLYGRGSNDDLGSGVVGSLIAMKHLAGKEELTWNVRLVVCCDEETGGGGGVEAIKAQDERLPARSEERILDGDVALIPDGDPHTAAACSGVAFGDATFPSPAPLGAALDFGESLVALNDLARSWKSRYPSPDWPSFGAPEPVITGRATVTRAELASVDGPSTGVGFRRFYAETEASNQIAEAVTLVFRGEPPAIERTSSLLAGTLPLPFRWTSGGRSSVRIGDEEAMFQVVGQSAHAGYPHRGHNPVPAAFALLREAVSRGWLDGGQPVEGSFSLDLRLPPETELERGVTEARSAVESWIERHASPAKFRFDPGRSRGGYALPLEHPLVRKVDRLLTEEFGRAGVYGEYGGTDASSLVGVRTPTGEQIPAVVFGSMDRASHIHEAEESVSPALLAGIVRTVERFATEP